MAQTQILETDKQVTVDQAIENYKRELDATGEDLTGSRPFAAGIFGFTSTHSKRAASTSIKPFAHT